MKPRTSPVQRKHETKATVKFEDNESKHNPFLFVHLDSDKPPKAPSKNDAEKIKRHLARRRGDSKGRSYKHLDIHPSISRIVSRPAAEGKHRWRPARPPAVKASEEKKAEAIVQYEDVQTQTSSALTTTTGTTSLDPFTSLDTTSLEVQPLLLLYCQILRPLAATISTKWEWADNLSQIQASPMLQNAVIAYASAFSTGMRSGARGVVLPPAGDRNPLWQTPAWFQYQARAVQLLNESLTDRDRITDSDVYLTILFLLRLSILFGDGATGRMHLKALQHVAKAQGKDHGNFTDELAVSNFNIISTYLYKSALVRQKVHVDSNTSSFVIAPDRNQWTDDHEWQKLESMLLCRGLMWQGRSAGPDMQMETQRNLLLLEPTAANLDTETFEQLAKHYQTALYLFSYLSHVSFDTTSAHIRVYTEELESYLKSRTFARLEIIMPKVGFVLLFICAFANRGHIARKWCIDRLAASSVQPSYMGELHALLEEFFEPGHCMPMLLEEVLKEILEKRTGRSDITKVELYRGKAHLPRYGRVPLSWSPDLSTPILDASEPEDGDTYTVRVINEV